MLETCCRVSFRWLSKPVRELLVVDLLDQLRKRLAGELALDVEDVAQLVEEQRPAARDVRHW